MIIDRFTKLGLSILVFSLCLNALNPWLSPTLANAEIEDTEIKNAMKIIAQGINRIADIYARQEERDLSRKIQELLRYEKEDQRAQLVYRLNLMDRANAIRAAQKRELKEDDTE